MPLLILEGIASIEVALPLIADRNQTEKTNTMYGTDVDREGGREKTSRAPLLHSLPLPALLRHGCITRGAAKETGWEAAEAIRE